MNHFEIHCENVHSKKTNSKLLNSFKQLHQFLLISDFLGILNFNTFFLSYANRYKYYQGIHFLFEIDY